MAFFIYNLLSDNVDGMSGTYLGKDWSNVLDLFNIYEVMHRQEVLYFMKIYERMVVPRINEKWEAERKRKSKK